MNRTEKFAIYNHRLVNSDDHRITEKSFIVLKHSDGTQTFTSFHKYVHNSSHPVRKYNSNDRSAFIFIVKFLNYAFFTAGISSLAELDVNIGRDFLNAYGMHNLSDDDEYTRRSKTTVQKCVDSVMNFYINLINDKKSGVHIKSDELYRTISSRNKYGKAVRKRIPVFEVRYVSDVKAPIFRDIPNKAFSLLFDHIAKEHTELLGLVMNQAFAGLRPSEACNVRRTDSPLGPGIRFKEVNGRLYRVEIDLTQELNLRSDCLYVGGIKKERTAIVPDIFLSAYRDAYNIYTEYMNVRAYEADYGAFSVNK